MVSRAQKNDTKLGQRCIYFRAEFHFRYRFYSFYDQSFSFLFRFRSFQVNRYRFPFRYR
jgi:hypothetical protein